MKLSFLPPEEQPEELLAAVRVLAAQDPFADDFLAAALAIEQHAQDIQSGACIDKTHFAAVELAEAMQLDHKQVDQNLTELRIVFTSVMDAQRDGSI